MTDAEFDAEVIDLVAETYAAIDMVEALHCCTPQQWEAMQRLLRAIAGQLAELTKPVYIN
jgi:hypothetical protein